VEFMCSSCCWNAAGSDDVLVLRCGRGRPGSDLTVCRLLVLMFLRLLGLLRPELQVRPTRGINIPVPRGFAA
jgi:hypothetical protein